MDHAVRPSLKRQMNSFPSFLSTVRALPPSVLYDIAQDRGRPSLMKTKGIVNKLKRTYKLGDTR
jgi:hypothetical protein